MEGATEPAQSKVCCGCNIDKPRGAFSPDRRRPDGLQSRCCECYNADRNARRLANPEPFRAQDRKRYHASPQRRSDIDKAKKRHLAENPGYQREHWHKNKPKRNAAQREFYAENRERLLAEKRAYYAADPEKFAKRNAEWRSVPANRRRAIIKSRQWQLDHPEQVSRNVRIRNERLAAVFVEEVWVDEIGDRDGWKCHICRRRVDQALRFPDPMAATIDHIVPIARGGVHAKSNVRLAHWGCNRRRGLGRKSPVQLPLL